MTFLPVLGTAGAFALGSLLEWPTHPWMRLGILPTCLLLLLLRDSSHRGLLGLRRTGVRVLIGLAGALLIGRMVQMGVRLSRPPTFMEDIAGTYWESLKALFAGLNPYREAVDPAGLETGAQYQGFKYPPLQLLIYAPGLELAGLRGYLATNALLYLVGLYVLVGWLRRLSPAHAALGAIFYLGADGYCTMVCVNGVNDIAPALLVLGSVLALETRRPSPLWAGVLAGLSALAKQFPAGTLVGVLFMLGRWRSVAWAAFTFVSGILIFVVWHPWALIRNLLEFQFFRPIRGTSILSAVPEHLRLYALSLGALVTLVLLAALRRRPLWDVVGVSLVMTILLGKLSPPNFFVWTQALMILMALDPGLKRPRMPIPS